MRVALPALTPRNTLPLEGAGIRCPFTSAASENFGVLSGFERVLQRFRAHLEVLAHQKQVLQNTHVHVFIQRFEEVLIRLNTITS